MDLLPKFVAKWRSRPMSLPEMFSPSPFSSNVTDTLSVAECKSGPYIGVALRVNKGIFAFTPIVIPLLLQSEVFKRSMPPNCKRPHQYNVIVFAAQIEEEILLKEEREERED